ncbi:DNA mismatch repair protein MutS [Candidatus Absconditicoccus praedator]|uniref:DNA mismatch repair protein MutS n=1 Tax=Candidatus Absconditicoccus praedator TaxID=2735562 RepID=UPI001E3E8C10|nr:DNA mismatch repair protein MutS [Candidatus Absconditicoccus praedator]UFX82575.1 DNA mismatch repair protein MutS [Candidatus Absconditicoccus praedator]
MTPAQRQYAELKNQYKDCILLFRMGDFYETFFEDAKILSSILDIVLTYKDKNSKTPTPMAGVPHHSVDKYLSKIIQIGYKVAIAEQVGQVVPGQLVKREVVNVLTPGTFLDGNEKNYNFIAGIVQNNSQEGNFHIAYGDFSLGEYFTKSFDSIDDVISFFIKINPSEIIIDIDLLEKQTLEEQINIYLDSLINISDVPYDQEGYLKTNLDIQTLGSYGKALQGGREKSFALLLSYLLDTQKQSIKNISKISHINDDNKVSLDENTIRNLEIFKSSYEGEKKYSLFSVINNTNTGMGNRKLNDIISNPTNDVKLLKKRLDQIEYFIQNPEIAQDIISKLKNLHDIPKLLSILLYKKNSPIIWEKLKNSFEVIFEGGENNILTQHILSIKNQDLSQIYKFSQELSSAIKEQPTENEYIKDGYDQQIDELRQIAYNSSKLILEYQQQIVQKTGIQGVKIKYISNQGYFIETTKKDSTKLEEYANPENQNFDFVRVQTLKSQERYTTTYLQQIQQKILTAKEKLTKLEKQIIDNLQNQLENLSKQINQFSDSIGFLDVFSSFGEFARVNNWIRPNIGTKGEMFIQQGRHPVIEKFLPTNENFVPNDLGMDDQSSIHIITGPNMGGKSTFLRQNAIIVLLAHCGIFVPAGKANIPTVDGIYARVGSGDIIAKNQSTFLTEMIEVANILNNATSKSFIILDELGRGTSTYDGVALAKSILQFLAENINSKTLFATHYHELINLENDYSNIKNFSVAVYETEKQVVFLKKISEGGANKSYGIDVAKIAGLPSWILKKAEENLHKLEKKQTQHKQAGLFELPSQKYDPNFEKIKQTLNQTNINETTPMQALKILDDLKNQLKD